MAARRLAALTTLTLPFLSFGALDSSRHHSPDACCCNSQASVSRLMVPKMVVDETDLALTAVRTLRSFSVALSRWTVLGREKHALRLFRTLGERNVRSWRRRLS